MFRAEVTAATSSIGRTGLWMTAAKDFRSSSDESAGNAPEVRRMAGIEPQTGSFRISLMNSRPFLSGMMWSVMTKSKGCPRVEFNFR